jgi:hypothetical protein
VTAVYSCPPPPASLKIMESFVVRDGAAAI